MLRRDKTYMEVVVSRIGPNVVGNCKKGQIGLQSSPLGCMNNLGMMQKRARGMFKP